MVNSREFLLPTGTELVILSQSAHHRVVHDDDFRVRAVDQFWSWVALHKMVIAEALPLDKRDQLLTRGVKLHHARGVSHGYHSSAYLSFGDSCRAVRAYGVPEEGYSFIRFGDRALFVRDFEAQTFLQEGSNLFHDIPGFLLWPDYADEEVVGISDVPQAAVVRIALIRAAAELVPLGEEHPNLFESLRGFRLSAFVPQAIYPASRLPDRVGQPDVLGEHGSRLPLVVSGSEFPHELVKLMQIDVGQQR